jgi:hypothetical protein
MLSDWLEVHGEKASPAEVRVLERHLSQAARERDLQAAVAVAAEARWGKSKARVRVLEGALGKILDTKNTQRNCSCGMVIDRAEEIDEIARRALASEGIPEEATKTTIPIPDSVGPLKVLLERLGRYPALTPLSTGTLIEMPCCGLCFDAEAIDCSQDGPSRVFWPPQWTCLNCHRTFAPNHDQSALSEIGSPEEAS